MKVDKNRKSHCLLKRRKIKKNQRSSEMVLWNLNST